MEPPPDPYDHPDDIDCIYIQTSVHHSDEIYDLKCSCTADNPCVDASCLCVKTCGVNYMGGRLVDAKLFNSNSSIFECNDSCGCGEPCRNRVSQLGPSGELKIVPSGVKGYGVVARGLIPRGTFLCEYAGEILSPGGMRTRAEDADWRYVITLNETTPDGSVTKTFIDASKFGNVGRYLNHSCDPNCVLVPIRYENVAPKVGIFALTDIQAGEECCYQYATADSQRSETPCHCGSGNCCGFLPHGFYKAT